MTVLKRLGNIDELRRNTVLTALAFGSVCLLLFICVFRVSNATALVILGGAGAVGLVSIITSGPWRFAVLAAAVAAVALEVMLREEPTALFTFSVLARFLVAGLLITYFASLLTDLSRRIYLDMKHLAAERERAASLLEKWLARGNSLLILMSAISSKTRLQEIFSVTLEQARLALAADSGLIYSMDHESGRLSITGSFGYSPGLVERMNDKWERRGADISSCLACSRMQPLLVKDLSGDGKCDNLRSVTSGSSICVPITGGDTLWGVLHLRRAGGEGFEPEDTHLAQAVTYQVGLAMQRSALFEKVNLLAVTDPVTGLFNYRQLERDLASEIARSRRYRHPFSFIMADVDRFKAINDVRGHLAGDAVLREVGRVMLEHSREVDRVYRYAGDEFAVLLPETALPEGLEVAEKIRAGVAGLEARVPDGGGPVSVTLSLGVAVYEGGPEDGRALVAAADAALYEAKREGRDGIRAGR